MPPTPFCDGSRNSQKVVPEVQKLVAEPLMKPVLGFSAAAPEASARNSVLVAVSTPSL